MRSLSVVVVAVALFFASMARAQNCDRGCPCGNTCISCQDTCRVGGGTANSGNGGDTPPARSSVDLVPLLVIVGATAAALVAGVAIWIGIDAMQKQSTYVPGPQGRQPAADDYQREYNDRNRAPTRYLDHADIFERCLRQVCGTHEWCRDSEIKKKQMSESFDEWLNANNCSAANYELAP